MSTAALPRPFDTTGGLGPIVVMGVWDCSKTSVGERLASMLGCRFIEGDSRHPVANVEKMRQGVPLDDADRWPWLEVLGTELGEDARTIISCSALKRSYRDLLRARAGRSMTFVLLQGTRTLLAPRMVARNGHYMPLSLLDSQLATLELPVGERQVVKVEIDQPVERVVSDALARITATGIASAKHNQ